jgi:hypothetical protein
MKNISLSSAYTTAYDKRRERHDEKIKFINNNKRELEKRGQFLLKDTEDLPSFGPVMPIEKIFSRSKNRNGPTGGRILFTKDNYGPIQSGIGGYGGTSCEAIDIVVGTLGNEPELKLGDIQSRANFASDGARIYLTERSLGLDSYFGLKESQPGPFNSFISGIGIKADQTLVIGRHELKLLAGNANFLPKGEADLLATGVYSQKPRVKIGNSQEDVFQPAVLGDNLKEYLREIVQQISKLEEKIQTVERKLIKLEVSYAVHNHQGAGLGVIQTFPAVNAVTHTTQAIPKFFTKQFESVIDTINRNITQFNNIGVSSETGETLIKGAGDICSSTVFIGK